MPVRASVSGPVAARNKPEWAHWACFDALPRPDARPAASSPPGIVCASTGKSTEDRSVKKLLIGLLALVVILAAIGLIAPKDYQVERSVTIQAPAAEVHAWVGELTKWPEWVPWEEDDPTLETTYGEQTTGVGAHQTWTGKDGDGELTFTKCDPEQGIAYEMAFIMEDKRVPATSAMTYRSAEGGGTEVIWTMEGSWKGAVPPVMDGWMKILSPWMLGSAFDRGLTKLKGRVEASG
jgi:hypothetical protein